MGYLEEGRGGDNAPRCQKQEGSWPGAQTVANDVCVEMTSAAEHHVFVRRVRTYCRAAIVLDK